MRKLLAILLYFVCIPIVAQQSSFSKGKLLLAPIEGGFSMDNYWVWGASVIEEKGVYHLYATRVPMSYKFHPGWMIASEIVHATSDKLDGPYHFSEVTLERRGRQYWDGLSTYNPQIFKYDGKYYLFYGGTRHPYEDPTNEQLTLKSKWCISSRANKRIGLAVADSPYGPWKRKDKPIIDVETNTFYSYLTSNPAPVILPDGQVYLIFKGRQFLDNHNYSQMQLGVAYATHPNASFSVLNNREPVFKLEQGEAEDPFLWYEDGCFYAVFKDQVGKYTGERGAGAMAYSKDCIHWTICNPAKAYTKEITWSDGRKTYQGNLERPFIFFRQGKPICLFFATMDGTGFNGRKAWNMAIPVSPE